MFLAGAYFGAYFKGDMMNLTYAKAPLAIKAVETLSTLQKRFVTKLDALCDIEKPFEPVTWGRDGGMHGGGTRFVASDERVFDRASVNFSQVHYDDMPEKKLSSATAISTIIHPRNPHVPSMHMHISWTEMRDGKGYWRVMADLNPSIINADEKASFDAMLKEAAGRHYELGSTQGDKYFNIAALERTRGVSHFYLEGFSSDDTEADALFAQSFGEAVIDRYIEIITNAMQRRTAITTDDEQQQLAYHTLYLFQVLTLDRGTTSGLMVHSQNDVGILGSIPSHIDVALLRSWRERLSRPQDALLDAIVDALGTESICEVNEAVKVRLALAVREHYKTYPEALSLQASGFTTPPTVQNHK